MGGTTIDEVKRLKVEPGEMLVLKCDISLSRAAHEDIVAQLRGLFPNNLCMVLEGGMELEVARAAEDWPERLREAFERVATDSFADRVATAVTAGLMSYGRVDPDLGRAAHEAARKGFLDA